MISSIFSIGRNRCVYFRFFVCVFVCLCVSLSLSLPLTSIEDLELMQGLKHAPSCAAKQVARKRKEREIEYNKKQEVGAWL